MSDRHKKAEFKCPDCPETFIRQLRRVKGKRPKCSLCSRRNPSNRVKFLSTEFLQSVVTNSGTTDGGRDYEHVLDDMKDILWSRQENKIMKQLKQLEGK